MLDAIPEPRDEMSEYAPRVELIQIDREKIGAVIGPGGRVINAIQEETGSKITVEDDGTVLVAGTDADGVRRALDTIRGLTKEVEIGEVYEGSVSRIMAFGAFVEILPGKDGLVHISDLADYHVNRVEDEVSEGEVLRVQVIEIDNLGRINLTRLRDGDDGSERVGLADGADEPQREPAFSGGGGGGGRGGPGGGRGGPGGGGRGGPGGGGRGGPGGGGRGGPRRRRPWWSRRRRSWWSRRRRAVVVPAAEAVVAPAAEVVVAPAAEEVTVAAAVAVATPAAAVAAATPAAAVVVAATAVAAGSPEAVN